jgi:hypothetical protein
MYLYARGQAIDWRIVKVTAWLYLAAFAVYCLHRLIRAWLGVRGDDRARAIGQSMLLCTFEAEARELVNRLEEAWQRWQSSGENLLCPLTENPTKNTGACDLQVELHDFKLLYVTHMQRVAIDAPYFISNALAAGLRSDHEYPVVLRDLKEHAEGLLEMAIDLKVGR